MSDFVCGMGNVLSVCVCVCLSVCVRGREFLAKKTAFSSHGI